jgi:quinol monooxygenase YgiN
MDVSVLITAKFQGDTAKFRQALTSRAHEFAKVADTSRAAGGIHHRFGVGDGFVIVIDEWESIEHFQQFFADPALQAFIASTGAAPGPPEITVAEAVTSADQF